MFEPIFQGISMDEAGVNIQQLTTALKQNPKLFYTIPNFQNPSGISYSDQKRQAVAKAISESQTVLVEDDPYGELRFMGEEIPLIRKYLAADHCWKRVFCWAHFRRLWLPDYAWDQYMLKQEIMEKLIICKTSI